MQSDFQTPINNLFDRFSLENSIIQPIIESYATISIDINITQSSLYKKYKWITSLKLITSEQYHTNLTLNKHLINQTSIKFLHIDKLLYLLVKFCEEGLPPITRIRTMKFLSDEDWIVLPYPKQSEGLYQLFICYQNKQASECKRIITDIQICSGRELEGVGRGDQWQIAKIPQFSINYFNSSNQGRQKSKQRKTGTGSNGNIPSYDSDDIAIQSKISDLSNKLQMSDLSINSYYSCQEGTSQKQSNQRQQLSDRPPISPGSLGRESYQDNKKSSLTQFHSMQEQQSPLYFIMKTVDLFDSHNQFQYVYQPKKDEVVHLFNSKDSIDYNTLSNFCFPNGIKLSKKIEGWGYQIFNFILTTSQGDRLYAYCLKFQQLMDSYHQSKLINQLGDLGFITNGIDNKKHQIYAQKAFCLISRRCQTDIFYKILTHLYKVYLSFARKLQIDFFPDSKNQKKQFDFFSIKMVKYLQNLQQIYINKRNNKKISLQITYQNKDEENIKFSWCDMHLQIPKYTLQPLSSKSLYCLLKCLSVDNIIKILVSILTDKKIFFVSNLQNVLGYVIQAFTNIIYPLKWNHVIIPIITYHIIDYIEAPMPIIAGMKDEMANQQTISLSKGIYVFLDCNKLFIVDQIPQAPNHFYQLEKKLKPYSVYNKMHVEQLLNFQQSAYSFDIRQLEQHTIEKTQKIKQIFFDSMIKLLKNYRLFFNIQQENISISSKTRNSLTQSKKRNNMNQRSQRNNLKQNKSGQKQQNFRCVSQRPQLHKSFNELYNCQNFVQYHSKSSQPFYRQFCKSLCFATLIQNKFYYAQNYPQIKLLDTAIEQLSQNNHQKAYSCLSIIQSKEKHSNLKLKKQIPRQKDHIKHKGLAVTSKKTRQSTTQRLERDPQNRQLNHQNYQQKRSVRNKNIPNKQLKPIAIGQIFQQRYSQGRNYTNALREQEQTQNDKPNQIYFDDEPYDNKKRKTVGGNICMMVKSLSKKVSQSGSLVAVWTQAKVNRLKMYFKDEQKQNKMNRRKKDRQINKLNKEVIKEQSQFKITIAQEAHTCITQKKGKIYKE